jgi:hypothetical protein
VADEDEARARLIVREALSSHTEWR